MDYDRLRELQQKFEENPRRYFAPLANEYRKGGQPKRAIEICRSQLTQMPGHMSGQIVYAQSLYECGEFDEARQVFERALALDPENLIALRSLGDMSLQSGNTVEARKWYQRLLDADPKDPTVIALVTEIDSAAEATPVPTPQEIPGVDADVGDQAIPFITDLQGANVGAEAASPAPSEPVAEAASEPVEAQAPSEPASQPEPIEASAPPYVHPLDVAPPVGLQGNYPIDPVEAGLPDEGMGAEGLRGGRQDELMGAEGLLGTEPESPPEPVGAEGLAGNMPPQALAGTTSTRSDDEDALETWTPPPEADVNERVESRKEDRIVSGPGPEPFVNETMAQLYLQQGYRQLALRVYYQLAESRPNDQALKDRIAEIEAADHAAHPEPAAPAPSAPAPSARAPEAARAETPPPQASRPRESADTRAREAPAYEAPRAPAYDEPRAPAYDEPRAPADDRSQPLGIAARQPSVREFFATLGRRRPPRTAGSPGGNARPSKPVPADTAAPLGNAAPSASLDAVFAGATVSPSDSRAAARLAGAFSGTAGTPRTAPPTPPMPTPRVNPRMPQAQESEEDVAKFRAWLDGLTGE
ncbi:MAG TPA: tetratricopeptide repeat protein [Gemmatimonadaceae bacterium]|nr:tetratricopeptide repeat protein [Gemmatimonadaceae bacterium]